MDILRATKITKNSALLRAKNPFFNIRDKFNASSTGHHQILEEPQGFMPR